MGKFIALTPQKVGTDIIAPGEEVPGVDEWKPGVRDRYILSGDIEYVPDDGEQYDGPLPNGIYVPPSRIKAPAPVVEAEPENDENGEDAPTEEPTLSLEDDPNVELVDPESLGPPVQASTTQPRRPQGGARKRR